MLFPEGKHAVDDAVVVATAPIRLDRHGLDLVELAKTFQQSPLFRLVRVPGQKAEGGRRIWMMDR